MLIDSVSWFLDECFFVDNLWLASFSFELSLTLVFSCQVLICQISDNDDFFFLYKGLLP